jgi:hypothetical protein
MSFSIFPLKPGGKVPLISKDDGGRGVHDATSDLSQIRSWWGRWPDANIGLACGIGFWVLDVDYAGWTTTEPDGADSLVYLADHFGRLPRTIRQYTGGMGWQYL